MLFRSMTLALFGMTLVHCTTNTIQTDSTASDAGIQVTSDEICAKLSRLSCGLSIATCNANFNACTGTADAKQAMLDCLGTADFTCAGEPLPTTTSCGPETARACPTTGDAAAPDASAPTVDASTAPSGVCAGLCANGVPASYTCTDSFGETTNLMITVGNDGTFQMLPACVDGTYTYKCDQTVIDYRFGNGTQVGSWSRAGKTLNITRSGAAYTCTLH